MAAWDIAEIAVDGRRASDYGRSVIAQTGCLACLFAGLRGLMANSWT